MSLLAAGLLPPVSKQHQRLFERRKDNVGADPMCGDWHQLAETQAARFGRLTTGTRDGKQQEQQPHPGTPTCHDRWNLSRVLYPVV